MISNALLLAAALAAAPAAPAAPPAPAPARRTFDRVAALVNGEVVTLRELERRAGFEWERVERLPDGPEREQARVAVLRRAFEQVVAERLFESEAKNLEIEIGDAQVDAAISDIKKRNGFDDEQLDRALAEQGIDRATFRAQVKRELTNFSLLQYKVRSRVKVSDEDLRAYYQAHPREFGGDDEVRVRHIFLPVGADASDAEFARVRARGEAALQRLDTGEDFAAVAREVSKAPTAADGGELGWIRRGAIQRALEDAIFALQPGQHSRLVEAGPGFHIVRAEEQRRSGAKPFDEVKEEIRMRLLEEQGETYRQQYLAELRKDALIDPKLPELKD